MWSLARVLVAAGAAAVLIVGGLLGLGYVRAWGPFGSLGLDEATAVQPERFGVLAESDEPAQYFAVFPWTEPGLCPGDFTVRVTETDTQVRIGAVYPHRLQTGGSCDPTKSDGGRGFVEVNLSSPLGQRTVVRDGDGAGLPQVTLGA